MSISAWAYDKDLYWLIDMIDIVRGTGYCENEWDRKLKKEAIKRMEKSDGNRRDRSARE